MAKKRAHKPKRVPKSKGQRQPKGETFKLGGMKAKGHGTVMLNPSGKGMKIVDTPTQQTGRRK